ncbi:MAG: flagellar biosynthesis anti-sigma factor FlgM [Inconstantimicrobium porci]|uniref:Negative regulator of flagellin synthesis n=1 Tax=Inconstantimicrobium porci TaxID=2652291 RepID=A0A7X2N0A4_9CLOT|nr:flagellar biosynthesis anti-sigma factor FlgM [Inconstantimicrobium porci]MDD6770417.1 flagellar biosynthesis anti-sigma factor FlgM [Inconstantimicrobium porci]MDY5913210.1 flagellar biosynthesis anti-sigma factor FlgM [Inconstantimicrobium porci]MSR91850.1 flagellar biosynthesis anti-sigma factor FlgM [Inconstantimicrobium porci]
MNINKIASTSNITKVYNSNRVNSIQHTKKVDTDKIEISDAARVLSSMSDDLCGIDREKKVEAVRNQITNGTYKCDAKLIAGGIVKAIKEQR